MKKYFSVIAIGAICLLSFTGTSPVGKMFPELSGETYDSKKINLPRDTKGKYTLLGMAYSKGAEEDLKTWIHPIYNKFIVKRDDNSAFDMNYNYDVHLYFIPMFSGINKLTMEQSKKKLRNDTDPQLHPHVIFYEGDLKMYQEQLGLKDKNTPYFFILDKTGKIIYSTSGRFSNDKIDDIEELID